LEGAEGRHAGEGLLVTCTMKGGVEDDNDARNEGCERNDDEDDSEDHV